MPSRHRKPPAAAEIYSVSQLNREARRLLETGLARLWVTGEISNLARPGSGHIYFSLKDDKAQVRCAMFRAANRSLSFSPENGNQVVVEARVSIYEARGDYQLIAENMEEAGEGLLRRKFEELKARLDAEGLFAEAHKQPLPSLPRAIGVITSPSGAAIRDILNVLARRYPAASVTVYPTRVQGEGANDEIVAAIQLAITRNECDVLIVARGGGSLEDLWSFNEENVARAIYNCPLPIVSGVGHEVDFSITDLVADLRAPTPSGAAELVVPDHAELIRMLSSLVRRRDIALRRIFHIQADRLQQLSSRLKRMHPGAVVNQGRQRIDELAGRLLASTQILLKGATSSHATLQLRLSHAAPTATLLNLKTQLTARQRELKSGIEKVLDARNSRIAVAMSSLNAVSPLATLERGYAIVRQSGTGEVVRDASTLKKGADITAQLASGELQATVTGIKSGKD